VRRRLSSELIARIALDDPDDKKDARLVRGETSMHPGGGQSSSSTDL
jgi:hypothetical protein